LAELCPLFQGVIGNHVWRIQEREGAGKKLGDDSYVAGFGVGDPHMLTYP
jgi:hypothetical protein